MTNREAYERDCNELDAYKEIGTVEECRQAVEKQKAKKPVLRNDNGKLRKSCPVCGCFFSPLSRSCPKCGKMSEIKLKPCPHCGSINLEFTDMHDLEECGNFDTDYCPCNEYDSTAHCAYTSVVCTVQKGGCGASSGYYLTKEEAAEAWNRRADNE